ncbi:MAG: DUF523 domain-containing protein, partial [Asgard group archaeon]|nr:DUF523 domain-containing protein [Asgard group archaeon]
MLINSLNNKIDKHFPEKNKIILVSACLLGINCAYDNLNNRDDNVLRIMKYRKLLPICPEQLGGLPTPREPQCIIKGNGHDVLKKRANVINRKNIDVTDNFLKGAAETIKLVKLYEIK